MDQAIGKILRTTQTVDGQKIRTDVQYHFFLPPRSPETMLQLRRSRSWFLFDSFCTIAGGPTFGIVLGEHGDEHRNALLPKSASKLDSLFLFDFIVHLLSRLCGKSFRCLGPCTVSEFIYFAKIVFGR